MKKLLLLFVFLISTMLLAGCGQSPSTPRPAENGVRTIRIAYLPITHALPLFAAKELETPDGPIKIELIKYGSWPELMDALNTCLLYTSPSPRD